MTDMDCPACAEPTVAFAVPAGLQGYLPGAESAAALCSTCLTLHPVADSPTDEPSFDGVSDSFPSNDGAAVPFALLLGLLENLALYRSEISDLLERVERAGTDPLLALDRLDRDPELHPAVDLSGRRRQLEQLL